MPNSAEQRAVLIPRIAEFVELLERVTGESFQDWLDTGVPTRSALASTGRIGTGHNSIDRPV